MTSAKQQRIEAAAQAYREAACDFFEQQGAASAHAKGLPYPPRRWADLTDEQRERECVAIDAALAAGRHGRPLSQLGSGDDFFQQLLDIEEAAVRLFNPPDNDTASVESILEDAAKFIESIPCTCTPAMVGNCEPCARCEVLGRLGGRTVPR